MKQRGRAITAKDKRKQTIMKEIKKRTGANRVTCVCETADHFIGSPMVREKGESHYTTLPDCWIPKTELVFN